VLEGATREISRPSPGGFSKTATGSYSTGG
jgi:hypothetical protein